MDISSIPCVTCRWSLKVKNHIRMCCDCMNAWHVDCGPPTDSLECPCVNYIDVKGGIPVVCLGEGCHTPNAVLCTSCVSKAKDQLESFVLTKRQGCSVNDAICMGCNLQPLMGCSGQSNLSKQRFIAAKEIILTSRLMRIKDNMVHHVFNMMIKSVIQSGCGVDPMTYSFGFPCIQGHHIYNIFV